MKMITVRVGGMRNISQFRTAISGNKILPICSPENTSVIYNNILNNRFEMTLYMIIGGHENLLLHILSE